jgi:hypothetical protein
MNSVHGNTVDGTALILNKKAKYNATAESVIDSHPIMLRIPQIPGTCGRECSTTSDEVGVIASVF